jgi:hypothetical protein
VWAPAQAFKELTPGFQSNVQRLGACEEGRPLARTFVLVWRAALNLELEHHGHQHRAGADPIVAGLLLGVSQGLVGRPSCGCGGFGIFSRLSFLSFGVAMRLCSLVPGHSLSFWEVRVVAAGLANELGLQGR